MTVDVAALGFSIDSNPVVQARERLEQMAVSAKTAHAQAKELLAGTGLLTSEVRRLAEAQDRQAIVLEKLVASQGKLITGAREYTQALQQAEPILQRQIGLWERLQRIANDRFFSTQGVTASATSPIAMANYDAANTFGSAVGISAPQVSAYQRLVSGTGGISASDPVGSRRLIEQAFFESGVEGRQLRRNLDRMGIDLGSMSPTKSNVDSVYQQALMAQGRQSVDLLERISEILNGSSREAIETRRLMERLTGKSLSGATESGALGSLSQALNGMSARDRAKFAREVLGITSADGLATLSEFRPLTEREQGFADVDALLAEDRRMLQLRNKQYLDSVSRSSSRFERPLTPERAFFQGRLDNMAQEDRNAFDEQASVTSFWTPSSILTYFERLKDAGTSGAESFFGFDDPRNGLAPTLDEARTRTRDRGRRQTDAAARAEERRRDFAALSPRLDRRDRLETEREYLSGRFAGAGVILDPATGLYRAVDPTDSDAVTAADEANRSLNPGVESGLRRGDAASIAGARRRGPLAVEQAQREVRRRDLSRFYESSEVDGIISDETAIASSGRTGNFNALMRSSENERSDLERLTRAYGENAEAVRRARAELQALNEVREGVINQGDQSQRERELLALSTQQLILDSRQRTTGLRDQGALREKGIANLGMGRFAASEQAIRDRYEQRLAGVTDPGLRAAIEAERDQEISGNGLGRREFLAQDDLYNSYAIEDIEDRRAVAFAGNRNERQREGARLRRGRQLDRAGITDEGERSAAFASTDRLVTAQQDLEKMERTLQTMDGISSSIANTLGSGLHRALTDSEFKMRDIQELLYSMVSDIQAMIIRQAVVEPIADWAMVGMRAAGAALFGGPTPAAHGRVFSGGKIRPFARGGVVSRPTTFPMADGVGLMGENGPEAIVPLRRLPNGDLGVQGNVGGGTSVSNKIEVYMNGSSGDAAADARFAQDTARQVSSAIDARMLEVARRQSRPGGFFKDVFDQ